MGVLLDTRSEGLWFGKQDEQGTPAAVMQKRLRKTGGDMNVARADGSGNYSDGQRFGDSQDYVDSVSADGSPAGQLQAGPTALLNAAILGDEEVTQVGVGSGLYDHVAKEGPAGTPLTVVKRVGEQVGPLRQQFPDAYVSSLRMEASSANKIGVVTPQFVVVGDGLGEILEEDPAVDFDTDDALLHTEGEGRYKIDGVVHRGTSQFAAVINDAISTRPGDSVYASDIAFGIATIALEGVTLGLNEQGLVRYFEQIYGLADPPPGSKPIDTLPALGSFEVDLRKGSQQRLAITGVPTGGDFTLTLAGRTTGAIDFDATAAAVQAALEAIVGPGLVVCTGGALPATPIKCVFRDVKPAMTVDDAGLTGGTAPEATVTNDGHYRGLKIEVPGVKWNPDLSIAGSVEGGTSEIALGAQVRRKTGSELIVVTTRNGDSAAY